MQKYQCIFPNTPLLEKEPIFTFIEKKRSEGKCGKLAMMAGLNKFLMAYYGKVSELCRSLPVTECAEISNILFEAT